jgi:hypothetical protein
VRLIKMLGLAMVAAAAVMAFVGASTALAVHFEVLCKENPVELCGPDKLLPKGTILHAALEPLVNAKGEKQLHGVLLGQTNELCNESSVSGKVTQTSEILGEITAVTFTGGCTPCSTVTMEGLPYKVKVVHDLVGEHLWLLLITGSIKAKFTGCPLGVSCTFETKEVHLDATNTAAGEPLILTLENELTRVAGSEFFCGNTGKWDANYLSKCLEPKGTVVECWLALHKLKEA